MKKILLGVIFCLALLIGFKLTYFDSLFIFGYDGYVITDEQFTQNLSSGSDIDKEKINGTKVSASDMVFINNGNYYFGEEKKMKFDKSYPVFINDGKALLTIDNSATLIDSHFNEEETYPNLILTNGILYQGLLNQKVSNETYYFMKTSNNFIINSQELIIETRLNTYTFPMNSIHNFQEESILSYVNTSSEFNYHVIHDIDFESIVKIGENQYSYKEFLKLLNLYKDADSHNNKITSGDNEGDGNLDNDSSGDFSANIQSGVNNGLGESSNLNDDKSLITDKGDHHENRGQTYVEPKVIVNELLASPYSINTALTIEDPKKNLVNSKVTFSVYKNDKLVMKRSYTENGDVDLEGLEPETEYTLIVTYAYRNEKREIINHEFLNIVVKTDSISSLKTIVFAGEKGEIFTNQISINQFHITSMLDTKQLDYLQTIQVKADDILFNLSKAEIDKLKTGASITFTSNASLSSHSIYPISIMIFDRFGNQLPSQFHTMTLTTSKQTPKISYKFDTKKLDEFVISLSKTDPDNVDVQNGKYQFYGIDADTNKEILIEEIEESTLIENKLYFSGFDFYTKYTIRYIGDYDLKDGKGLQTQVVINDYNFSGVSLSSLGGIYLTTKVPQITDDDLYTKLTKSYTSGISSYDYSIYYDKNYTFTYEVNSARSNDQLIDLLDKVELVLYMKDARGNRTEISKETFLKGSQVMNAIKNKNSFTKEFTDLDAAQQYFVEIKGYYLSNGIGIFSSVDNFTTWNETPSVYIKNVINASNQLTADFMVEDKNKVNSKKTVQVILQEFNESASHDYDKLTSGKVVDVAIINADGSYHTSTLSGLTAGKKYVMNTYTNNAEWNSTLNKIINEKVYLNSYVFDASHQLSGNLSLSSLTNTSGNNSQLDVNISGNITDLDNQGNGHYELEVFKNGVKIDSLSTNTTYPLNTSYDFTKQFTIDAEDTEYIIKLSTVSRTLGKRIALSEIQFNAKGALKEIYTKEDLYAVDGTNDRYIVKADISLDASFTKIKSFSGEIDFDGHTLSVSYGSGNKAVFDELTADGIIKNIKYTEKAFSGGTFGLIKVNNGTLKDVILEIQSQIQNYYYWGQSHLVGTNNGTIDGFVITATNTVYGETENTLGVRFNNGIIRNGYIDKALLDASPGGTTGNDRTGSLLVLYNESSGIIENVYSNGNIKLRPQHPMNNKVSYFTSVNRGTVRNVYSTKSIINLSESATLGPNVSNNSGKVSNNYYIHDTRTFNNNINTRIDAVSLTNSYFQNQVLNSNDKRFEINRFVENGYFPHLIFENANMKSQTLTKIPIIVSQNSLVYISSDVTKEANHPADDDYYAEVEITINNPYQKKIKDIQIDSLNTKILAQVDDIETGYSVIKVQVRIKDYAEYLDQYKLLSISGVDRTNMEEVLDMAHFNTYIPVSFYKGISSVRDWKNIDIDANTRKQNYMLTADIDFLGIQDNAYISQFSGKLDGNNHTISEINVSSSGTSIFKNVANGAEIKNLYVKNVDMSAVSGDTPNVGFISILSSGATVDNLHLTDMKITGSDSVGGLAGLHRGIIRNSSVTNTTITGIKTSSYLAERIGGLVGILSDNASITNSFVNGVTIDSYSKGSNRIGGLVGVTRTGFFSNSYANTIINAPNATKVGGLVGYLPSGHEVNIQSTYALFNITAQSSVGGLIGYTEQRGVLVGSGTYESRNMRSFVSGSIIAPGSDVGYLYGKALYEKPTGIYANESTSVNGVGYLEDKTMLTSEELLKASTYTNIIGLSDEFEKKDSINDVILPKLYYAETTNLLPHQKDMKLNTNSINLKSAVLEKENTYSQDATLVLTFHDTQDLEIQGFKFENMEHSDLDLINVDPASVAKQRYDKDKKEKVYSIKVRPNVFIDNYTLTDIYYKDSEGDNQTLRTKAVINTPFYRQIAVVSDWPTSRDNHYLENYYIAEDIDFGHLSSTITSESIFKDYFNKEVNKIHGTNHTFKNLDLSHLDLSADNFIVKSISGEVIDLNIANIKLNYTSGNNTTNVGLIGVLTGTMNNVYFKDIDIKAVGGGNNIGRYAGLIANASGNISNVNMTNITVVGGQEATGGLLGNASGSAKLSYIDADNVLVNAENNVAGLIGSVSNTVGIDFITAMNINVTSSANAGGLFGTATTTNLKTASNINVKDILVQQNGQPTAYVGGIAGNSSYVNFKNIIGENIRVSSTSQAAYTGGLSGYKNGTGDVNHVYLDNVLINGNANIGGLYGNIGPNATTAFTKVGVGINSITALGNNVGGLVGSYTRTTNNNNTVFVINEAFVTKSLSGSGVIKASHQVGGLVGSVEGQSAAITINNAYSAIDIDASGNGIGSIIGHMAGWSSNNWQIMTLNKVIAMGSIKGNVNIGMIGRVMGERSILRIDRVLMLSTLTSNVTRGAHPFIRYNESTAAALNSYSNIFIYDNLLMNGIVINQNDYTDDAYQFVERDEILTDDFFVLNQKMGLDISDKWDISAVTKNIAPKLISTSIPQPDIQMIRTTFLKSRMSVKNRAEELASVSAYASDIDKINLEFSKISEILEFEILQNGESQYSGIINQKTMTFNYDFKDSFAVLIKNGESEMIYSINPQDLIRKAYVANDNYYYIYNDGISSKDRKISGKYLHLYNGKALDVQGNIYNLSNGNIIDKVSNFSINDKIKPLFQFDIDGKTISTFAHHSLIIEGGQSIQRDMNIYVKNMQLGVIDSAMDAYKDSVIMDSLNGAEYLTLLGKDGRLHDLKDELPLPEGFINKDIEYMTHSFDSNSGDIVFIYRDGGILVYNYKNQETIAEVEASIEDVSFVSHMLRSLTTQIFASEPSRNEKYEASEETAQELMQTTLLHEIIEKESIDDTAQLDIKSASQHKSMNTRNIRNQLLSVYNSESQSYQLYSQNELLNIGQATISSIEEKAKMNEDIHALLTEKAVTAKTHIIVDILPITFIGISIGGCLIYLLKQRKKFN